MLMLDEKIYWLSVHIKGRYIAYMYIFLHKIYNTHTHKIRGTNQ